MTIFAGINNSQSWVVYGIVLPTLMGLSWDNNGIILGYHWNITYIYIYPHQFGLSLVMLRFAAGRRRRVTLRRRQRVQSRAQLACNVKNHHVVVDLGLGDDFTTWDNMGKKGTMQKSRIVFFSGIYGFFHGVMGTGLEKPSQHAKICPMLKLTYILHVKMISSQRYMHGSSFQSEEYIERSFWCLNFGKSSSFLKPMDMLYPTKKYLFKATLIKKEKSLTSPRTLLFIFVGCCYTI